MTQLLPLTQGKFAIVDDDVYEQVKNMKWHTSKRGKLWYAENNHRIFLHRLILNAQIGEDCDHIDRNGLNNQRSNLRLASKSQNCMNKPKSSIKTSKYKGVCWHKLGKKWSAQIYRNKIKYHLGLFTNEIDAARAYDKAALEFFSKYAYLNFPKGVITNV